jgi:phage protein D
MPQTNMDDIVSFEVKVNGQRLEDAYPVISITVDDHIDLPSMFTLEILSGTDYIGEEELFGESLFAIGDEIEIRMGYNDVLQTVILAKVTLVEIEVTQSGGPHLIVRGYDLRHRLQRGTKVRTFVKKKDSEIAKQIATEAGLASKVVDSTVVHEYLIQANQTDFAFLKERARRIHYELVVKDNILHFRPVAYDCAPVVTLTYGVNIYEFRAQLSSAGQVSRTQVRGWNSKDKQAVVAESESCVLLGGKLNGAKLTSQVFGEAQTLITGEPVANLQEARQRADAEFAASALGLIRAEVRFPGSTRINTGIIVEISGFGKRFNGPYYITTVKHVMEEGNYLNQITAWRNAT